MNKGVVVRLRIDVRAPVPPEAELVVRAEAYAPALAYDVRVHEMTVTAAKTPDGRWELDQVVAHGTLVDYEPDELDVTWTRGQLLSAPASVRGFGELLVAKLRRDGLQVPGESR